MKYRVCKFMFVLAVEEAGLKDNNFVSNVSASIPSYNENSFLNNYSEL